MSDDELPRLLRVVADILEERGLGMFQKEDAIVFLQRRAADTIERLADRWPNEDTDKLLADLREARAARERLETALTESVKLQSHYANLLNMYDGGKRMEFASSEEWLNRLDG